MSDENPQEPEDLLPDELLPNGDQAGLSRDPAEEQVSDALMPEEATEPAEAEEEGEEPQAEEKPEEPEKAEDLLPDEEEYDPSGVEAEPEPAKPAAKAAAKAAPASQPASREAWGLSREAEAGPAHEVMPLILPDAKPHPAEEPAAQTPQARVQERAAAKTQQRRARLGRRSAATQGAARSPAASPPEPAGDAGDAAEGKGQPAAASAQPAAAAGGELLRAIQELSAHLVGLVKLAEEQKAILAEIAKNVGSGGLK